MQQIITWISEWFSSQCNGDWEHENQIKIETLDNPGWAVRISVANTELDGMDFEADLVDVNDNDWFDYKIKDGKFMGYGDLSKLEFLLSKFKELVESNKSIK